MKTLLLRLRQLALVIVFSSLVPHVPVAHAGCADVLFGPESAPLPLTHRKALPSTPPCNCKPGITPSNLTSLSSAQQSAIMEAHLVGVGQLGKDGLPARVGFYTLAQLQEKTRILKAAGFDPLQRRGLMEAAIVGAPEGGIAEFVARFRPGTEVIYRSNSGNFYRGTFQKVDWLEGRLAVYNKGFNLYVERLRLDESALVGGVVRITSIRNNTRELVLEGISDDKLSLLVKEPGSTTTLKYLIKDVHPNVPIVSVTPQGPIRLPATASDLSVVLAGVHIPVANRAAAIEYLQNYGFKFPNTASIAERGADYYFGSAFMAHDRAMVPVIVNAAGEKSLRIFYRSNSQGGFRLLPAYNRSLPFAPGFDKATGEHSLVVPGRVQEALEIYTANNGNMLQISKDQAKEVLTSAGVYNETGAAWLDYNNGPEYPGRAISLQTLVSSPLAKEAIVPKDVVLISDKDGADFSKLIRTYEAQSTTAGKITAQVFVSKNAKWEWVYFRDSSGHVWIGQVTSNSAAINRFGLPSEAAAPCVQELLAPLWEYHKQIRFPASGPTVQHPTFDQYWLNWTFIKDLGEIKRYYQEFAGAGTVPP